MKLLITTQVLDRDDPGYFGFFHAWVLEFAKHCEQVTVICLREGAHDLPANVAVYSLGKPYAAKASQGAGKRLILRIKYAIRFVRLAWRLRREYDAVFVHMNPEYVVLMGWLWRLMHKRVALWYLHRSVDLKLRLAVPFVHNVLTASAESFRLATKKVRIAGHGVDPIFTPAAKAPADTLRLIYWGRLSPSKQVDLTLAALRVLAERGVKASFDIVGAAATPEDQKYVLRLKELAEGLPVRFVGGIPHHEVPGHLSGADICVNISTTQSMDKTVLEAMAAGLPVVSSNDSFREVLSPQRLYVANPADAEALADAIVQASKTDPAPFVDYVRQNHSLSALIPRILGVLYE